METNQVIYDLSHEELINKFTSRRSNDIYLFSNVFSNDMCNKLIDHVKKNAEDKLELGPNQNVQAYEDILQFENPLFKPISSKIIDIGKFINKKYHIPVGTQLADALKVNVLEEIRVRKIYGPTRIHCDSLICAPPERCSCWRATSAPSTSILTAGDTMISVKTLRSLSIIIALNGDYDGGELVFPCQNFKTRLKQGEAIIFPPYWTHPHYTEDLKNNTFRYTISTWLSI